MQKMFVSGVGFVDNVLRDIYKVGSKQAPPYNLDTLYQYTEHRCLQGWARDLPGSTFSKENATAATNQARAQFVNQLGDSSSFGATLTAEMRQTWGAVTSAITKSLLAAKAVKAGQLGKAAKILGFHPPTEWVSAKTRETRTIDGKRRGKRVRKKAGYQAWRMPDGKLVSQNLAGRWLWYSYGVKPLVVDIYNGLDVLTRLGPSHRVTGKGFGKSERAGPQTWYNERLSARSSVSISANVRVANPNLWLANQLGLINPVQWVNEAIPFSFIIDWFSNASQIIMQMTDFIGLEIARPSTTSKHVGIRTLTYPEYGNLTCSVESTYFDRTLTMPAAKLRFAYERFQWQRGANAISLLVGLLKKSPLR
jgi:hypothetical protein